MLFSSIDPIFPLSLSPPDTIPKVTFAVWAVVVSLEPQTLGEIIHFVLTVFARHDYSPGLRVVKYCIWSSGRPNMSPEVG